MADHAFLIPLIPFIGFLILFCTLGNLPRYWVAVIGVGSIGSSAIVVALLGIEFLSQKDPMPYAIHLYTWMNLAGFQPGVSFYIDGLTLTMMFVITGIGLLIHVYSSLFMFEEEDYSRFFSYMNLFVAAMLVLVLADNLLLLFLGWEGVGLCSYLLVGFWYQDSANGMAARKAFIVTRIGDTFMALGLFLLYQHLGTLDIQPMMHVATASWAIGDPTVTLACLLLVGGAVGKSAQLPLQTWLPDAMAGPTPVSALIHAATMVTAGVYLIARTHELFLLSPIALNIVALIGAATLIMAAFTAMTQSDIKRILAYSTISQIGYMFLALGVGAWASGIFHLVTHAFFKALLFLAAGAVIYSLHHEHNIFKMGGLRKKLPLAFWSFMIGSAALAALPFTSGFYSKDAILLSAWESGPMGPGLWAAGLLGALLTAIYSFRLVFIVFFGATQTEPDKPAGSVMAMPLLILCLLSLLGGLLTVPISQVFPPATALDHSGLIPAVTVAIPILGVLIAWLIFLRRSVDLGAITSSAVGKFLVTFWFRHWMMDSLYDRVFVKPYTFITLANRRDIIDSFYNGFAGALRLLHDYATLSQTGQLRTYALVMLMGVVALIAVFAGVITP